MKRFHATVPLAISRSLCSGPGGSRPPSFAAKALVTGLAAGTAGSLVGMGGGFVAIPAMTSRFMLMSQHQAHATSLVNVFCTGAAGGASFALAGSIDWGVAATVAGGGIVTANLGARLSSRLPGYVLKGLLGGFMCCVGPAVCFRKEIVTAYDENDHHPNGTESSDAEREESRETNRLSEPGSAAMSPLRIVKLLAVGGAVGVFCGVFGVGGGAVTVPAVRIYSSILILISSLSLV